MAGPTGRPSNRLRYHGFGKEIIVRSSQFYNDSGRLVFSFHLKLGVCVFKYEVGFRRNDIVGESFWRETRAVALIEGRSANKRNWGVTFTVKRDLKQMSRPSYGIPVKKQKATKITIRSIFSLNGWPIEMVKRGSAFSM